MEKEELKIKHTEHLSLAENAQTLLKIDLDNANKIEHLQWKKLNHCLDYLQISYFIRDSFPQY